MSSDDKLKQEYEESAKKLPTATVEQLKTIRSLCESLLVELGDCKPLGGDELIPYCKAVDTELAKRKLSLIKKPEKNWLCHS